MEMIGNIGKKVVEAYAKFAIEHPRAIMAVGAAGIGCAAYTWIKFGEQLGRLQAIIEMADIEKEESEED